jgi:hypothetical protein
MGGCSIEVKSFALVICATLLTGCSEMQSSSAEIHIEKACEYFKEFQKTAGYDNRRILLGSARVEFRKAAFEADSARFEVLAEHTESYLDGLGNLAEYSRVTLQDFCKDRS